MASERRLASRNVRRDVIAENTYHAFSHLKLPCPECSGRSNNTQSAAENYAKTRGGKLVAWAGNASTKSVWECNKGHQWLGSWSKLKTISTWCKRCRKVGKSNIDGDIKKLAKKALGSYLRYDKRKNFRSSIELEDVIAAKKE